MDLKDIMLNFERDDLSLINESDIMNLYGFFKDLKEEQKYKFRENIKDNTRLKILAYTAVLSKKANNTKNEDYLVAALTLITIENFKWDPRESVIYLAIIWFVSKKIKSDSLNLFKKIIDISSDKGIEMFSEFLSRSEFLKSLKAMGLTSIQKDGNLSFEQIPSPWSR